MAIQMTCIGHFVFCGILHNFVFGGREVGVPPPPPPTTLTNRGKISSSNLED